MTNSHPLTDFLVKLADDPQALAKFEKNPDAAMQAAGLPAAATAALKSGDQSKIEAAVRAEHPGTDPGAKILKKPISIKINITIRI